jgi:hypothetical protein
MTSEVPRPSGDGGGTRRFGKQEREAPVSDDKGAPETDIVRKLAEEYGIDLAGVSGSGPRGRVTREDMERLIREQGQDEQPPERGQDEQPPPDVSVPPSRERIDIAARALADKWSAEDHLGFSDYATALADLIEDARTKKPLTISIDAPWGMGKTTLMHMIESRLKEDRPNAPPLPTVWFNAWTYDKDEALWAALALEILRQVREEVGPLKRLALWLALNRERLNWRLLFLRFLRSLLLVLLVLLVAGAAIAGLRATNVQITPEEAWRYVGLIGGLGVVATLYNTIGKDLYRRLTSPFRLKIADYVEEPNYEEKVGYLPQFQKDFKRVIHVVTANGARPLVIFIDDLDRAAPPKPVEIFEAINMLLDSEHCAFVFGMDSQAVAKSIEAKFKDLVGDSAHADGSEPSLGRRFLEKIVQIPFVVPRADQGVFRTFISKNLEAGEGDGTVAADREEVVQAEKMIIEESQRQGSSLDEAAEVVRSKSDVATEAVDQAKVEIRAKSFGDSEEVRQAVAEAASYLEYNPRRVKRFINLFKLQALIANRRGLVDDGTVRFDHLAKWVIISTRWPTIVEGVLSDPDFINRLLEARENYDRMQAIEVPEDRDNFKRARLDPVLADTRIARLYRADEPLRLLNTLDPSDADISSYLYLTRVTSSRPALP